LVQPSNEPEEIAVRTAEWKYLRLRSGVIDEALYDLSRDPDERSNLAGDTRASQQIESMRATMRELLERTEPGGVVGAEGVVGAKDD
jgi:hypothetical protein